MGICRSGGPVKSSSWSGLDLCLQSSSEEVWRGGPVLMMPWMERSSFIGRWSLRLGMGLLAVVMLFPFAYVLAVSFSSPQDISNRLIIFPAHPSLAAYSWVINQTNAVQGLE